MAEEMNLYQKLARIGKQVEVIRKNKKGFNYSYVSDDEILARVSVFLDKYGISLIPNVSMGTLKVEPYTYKKTKVSKQGEIYEETVNEVLVSADMTWTWVNNNKPEERINVDWVLVGQQADASQALGSALTYTNRYFLLKFFNIATPDNDPDNFRGKQREAEAAEDRAIADEIINTFDEELKEFLESHKGKTEDAKKLVAKYVKDGNYFKIKESAVAAKLLDDFEKTFLDKE